ncbi:MAG TPA: autotransporter domain-containing protein [Devosia sp.]|jgi:hypothetical protein|uniref:autotransporter domain-containing protein n=1 Tax=Devosia sp. TaxID=1871048 RepID=UPI002DDCB6BE|nr:autotransporter domain-containing protein [Devosia sp.]HEV2517676.1 autotransporter domain-containing protein [Devosia sp.]
MSNTVKLKAGKRNRRAGNSSIRFVRVKSTDRAWLLAGTALFAGVIGIGVAGAPTRAVAADCLETTPTSNVWNCNGAETDPQDLTADGTFQVNIDGAPSPFLLDVNSGAAFTLNAGGFGGTIGLGATAHVVNQNGNGFVLNNAAGTVGITIDDLIEGGSSATTVGPVYAPGDGYRILGGTGAITLDVNAKGIIRGADDGLVVTAANSLVVNNRGEIIGRGLSTSDVNDGEGILVSSTGNFGGKIGGSVVINNHGKITGTARESDNPGGQGISVSTTSSVTIRNEVEYNNDVPSAARIIGTDGIIVAADGAVLIENDGHIEGTEGAGVRIVDAAGAEIQNHSYASMIGTTNGAEYDGIAGPVIYSGGGGLAAGLGGNGVYVNDIDNAGTSNDAVRINNNGAGVIAGRANGVYVQNVQGVAPGDNADVYINNDAHWDDKGTGTTADDEYRRGGLIAGVTEDGVYVNDIGGELNINNAGTLGDMFNLSVLDPKVSNGTTGLLDTDYLFDDVAAEMGIWGQRHGVSVYDVDRTVSVNNGGYTDEFGRAIGGGLIVGVNEDGVHIDGVEGILRTEGLNSWYQAANVGNADGLIWGGDDGVHIRDADGNANVENWGGTIFGIEDGVQIVDTWRGDAFVGNGGGRIQGFYGDGIKIDEVDSSGTYGGWAGVANGDFSGNNDPESEDYSPYWGTDGGLIWGADNAIDIEAERAWIGNGVGGIIVGDGDWRQPVIRLDTSNDEEQGANIINRGLITSDNLPYFERGWTAPLAKNVPVDPLDSTDIAQLLADYGNTAEFVWSGGQSGSVDNLYLYAEAASDVLLRSRGGAVDYTNDSTGVMIGRVNMDGHNDTEDGWPNVRGNSIRNFGTWLTVNNGEWGNEMHGSANDEIMNAGLIQTALDWDAYETSTFEGVNQFHNGGFYGESGYVAEYGLLSMIDDGTGDYTWIDHNFRGSQGNELTSFVGLDVNFGPGAALADVDEGNPSTWRADFLDIEDEITGTTGLIINKVGSSGTNLWGDQIAVAYAPVDGNDASMQCYDEACAEGDTMYIDSASEGYINVAGVGAIQDGFYAWYLHEEGVAPDPLFVLESEWAPQAVQLPSLITAAQNIWHDTAGQVADHVYGNHFPLSGNGGGGADLPVGELPIEASAAPGAALWAKATGSWTDRSTEVAQEIPPAAPITIDTSFVQDTFSILAGADFQPMGGGDDGLRAGVFGGFVSSSLEFDTYGASADFSGGIVGAYAAYTMGGFYADAEVKADLLQVTYAAPISPGFETTGASTSIGILANTGYRMELGDTAFFEPIASLSFVSTELEGFDAGGASVEFSNGNSLQGGIGARAGMTLGTPGDTTTEIAVLGKIWNEFEDANVVTITDGMGASTSFQDGISGVFGELSGSATMYSADKSFSAFGSAGVKFNDSFTTVDAKVGVRKGF